MDIAVIGKSDIKLILETLLSPTGRKAIWIAHQPDHARQATANPQGAAEKHASAGGRTGGATATLGPPAAGPMSLADAQAKAQVLSPVSGLGFPAVNAGPLKSARYLEPLAALVIQLGYGQKRGTRFELRLV
jgi:hypothetical protein